MLGIELLRFKIIVTTMLITSVVINAMVMPLAVASPSEPDLPDLETSDGADFDYTDYKYVYINYASWIIVLLLLYGLGALGYSLITKSSTDFASIFRDFNTFIMGGEVLPTPRPTIQLAVTFILVSFAMSMYAVEARRADAGFLDGAMRFKSVAKEQDEEVGSIDVEDEKAKRDAYRRDLVEAMNWIHTGCILCFAVAFIRALQFE